MQVEPVGRLEVTEVLPPEQTGEERAHILHKALADSAKGLSVDERYVLRKLKYHLSNSTFEGSFCGCRVGVHVEEFSIDAGLTVKAARRRLDRAATALFSRSVSIQFGDETLEFRWVDLYCHTDDVFELNFPSMFLKYLHAIAVAERAPESLQPFFAALNAPSEVSRGFKIPSDMSVVFVSRHKAHVGRPQGMTLEQLLQRLIKRLRRVLGRDEACDAIDALLAQGTLSRSATKYSRYTHRHMRQMYRWVMENKDKPGFLDI